jgi:hypothetical protein
MPLIEDLNLIAWQLSVGKNAFTNLRRMPSLIQLNRPTKATIV